MTDLKRVSHRTQLRRSRNVRGTGWLVLEFPGANRAPFRRFHAGQVGCFLYRAAASLTGRLDTVAKKPAQRLALDEKKVFLPVKSHTHIHNAP